MLTLEDVKVTRGYARKAGLKILPFNIKNNIKPDIVVT